MSQVDIKVSAKWRDRVLKCRRYSSVFTVGTFRGFGTDRARLGPLNPNFEIFTQNEQIPAQRFFS